MAQVQVRLDATPLVQLASAMGLDLDDLQLGDRLTAFERSPDVVRERLAATPWSEVRQLMEAYGQAVRLEVEYEDTPDTTLNLGMTLAEWERYVARLESSGRYRLRIRIDKLSLLEHAGLRNDNTTHFFFASTFVNIVESGLGAFEAALWRTPNEPALVLLGDTELDLEGPLLRVVGGAPLHNVAPAHQELSADRVIALRDAQRELVSVEAPDLKEVTPWHLRLDRATVTSDLGERLRRGLAAAEAQLCLIAICDRARPGGGPTTATRLEFRGVERLATVRVDMASDDLRSVSEAERHALQSVVDWCYEDVLRPAERDWTAQRLHFVQVRLARLVGVGPEEERLLGLLRVLAEVDATKEVFWKAFLEETVSDYLERLRDLEVEIDATADAYAERAAGIVERLTSNMLAAVAAVIASFIAAAFERRFNADLFQVALRTYAVYLAVFPAALGLSSQLARYRDIDKQFSRRKESFERILGQTYVGEMLGDRVTRVQRRWWLAFAAALFLYLAVVVAAWLGASKLPPMVTSTG